MKNIKKFTFLTLFSLLLSSCNKANGPIGLFLYSNEDTFIKTLSLHLSQVFKDKKEYKLNVFDGENNQNNQIRQIVNSLEYDNTKTLIVNMVDRLSSNTIIQKAKLHDASVIFFNREPVVSDIKNEKNIYYVGTNPELEGIHQAKMALNLLKDPHNLNKKIDKNGNNKLDCVFLRGEQGHQDTEKRTYACIDYLNKSGVELNILKMDYADWLRSKAKISMEEMYVEFGNEIEFVFSNNDDMALGAIDYLVEENIFKANSTYSEQPFVIVGVDGTEVGIKAIKDGFLYGTSLNDYREQSKAIYELVQFIDKKISIEDFHYQFINDCYLYIEGTMLTSDTIGTFKY